MDQKILKASLNELEELVWEQLNLGQVNTFRLLSKVYEQRVIKYGDYFAAKRDSGDESFDGFAGEGDSGPV